MGSPTPALAGVIVSALGQIGIQTASFMAVLGAAGLAIGLALQGSLSNFAAGVLLVVFRPFRVGDYVEAGGVGGTWREARRTKSSGTSDNRKQIIPNSQITDAPSARSPTSRP